MKFPWSKPPQPAPKSLPAFDILVFPVIDWEFRFQRPQHLSIELAQRGHRVFYFSTKLLPELGVRDPAPLLHDRGVTVFALPGGENPPDIYRDLPDALQLAAMTFGLRCLQEKYSIGATVSIVDYPFWTPLAARLRHNFTVFDCMDDYASFANAGRPARELAAETVRAADLVVCSSAHLQTSVRGPSLLIRNAADTGHFATPPAALALERDGRTVGYHGALAHWTDLDLIAQAARSLPELRFVLVGGIETDVSALRALPNVTLTGEVPYARLPEYVHAFDVCLLPYRICDYSLASDPVKVWEYLSAGKPVVARRYPEIEWLQDHIALTDTPDEFTAAIRAALQDQDREARQAFARQHTWSQRCDVLYDRLLRFFPKLSVVVPCHNQLRFTRTALQALEDFSHYPHLEIVAVDNGSTDGTAAFLEEWAASRDYARTLRLQTNRGFAAACNHGARAATGEYLVLMNNDVFVTAGWAGGLLRHFHAEPRLGLLSPVTNRSGNESDVEIGTYKNMEEMAMLARRFTRARPGRRTPLSVAHFFCVMMPRRVWEETGPLDENFGLGLFEDDDYSARVQQRGYELACADDVFVHHHHSATLAELPADEYDALFERNRRYFESKWGPWKPPRARPQ